MNRQAWLRGNWNRKFILKSGLLLLSSPGGTYFARQLMMYSGLEGKIVRVDPVNHIVVVRTNLGTEI
jgi:hypothetical protein